MKFGLCGEISTTMFLTTEKGVMGFAQNTKKYIYAGSHKPKDNNVILISQRLINNFLSSLHAK